MADLIAALQDPRRFPHPVNAVRIIETHISWVLLTGAFAYKIKKPVKLDFADFSTLERRRDYCFRELQLNRRLARELYLDVVPITGSAADPQVGGAGEAIEYAVRMREFAQHDLLADRIARGAVAPEQIDALADILAAFHERAAVAAPDSRFGAAGALLQAALDNFTAIERLLSGNGMHLRIGALKRFTQQCHARLANVFAERRERGRIRECHGDLHSGNIALMDDAPVIFDCIEFNESFRWIDVIDEVAFLVMDLAARGRSDFGFRCLDRYLAAGGDYHGLALLRYYLVYRAMVRAKIDCIRARQPGIAPDAGTREWQDFLARIVLAERFAARGPRLLAITFGLAGSGKSTAALCAVERLGMIRLRSDVERKRLHGLRPDAASHSALDGGIYAPGTSAQVYDRLARLATGAIEAGFAVIVDAAFLTRDTRRRFRQLAASTGARFAIVHCRASDAVLASRIEQRQRAGRDASEAGMEVLRAQQHAIEALDESEAAVAVEVDGADAQALERMVLALGSGQDAPGAG